MNRCRWLLYLLALPAFALFGQTNGQHHVCQAGDKDYEPGHPLALQKKTEGYAVALTVGADDWYDPKVLGREANDWLKAAGVSYFSWFRTSTWAKNHLSALVGFRMKPDRRFEVCAYVNDLDGKFRYDGVVSAAVGDTIYVEYRVSENRADYTVSHAGISVRVSFDNFETTGRQVAVGPWHGGSVPAPVSTGIWTSFSYRE